MGDEIGPQALSQLEITARASLKEPLVERRKAHRRAAISRARNRARPKIERALMQAKAKGHRLVVLVGDEPYYGKVGFTPIAKDRTAMPGPVDPARLLVCELADGAFDGVSGPIRPDWTAD